MNTENLPQTTEQEQKKLPPIELELMPGNKKSVRVKFNGKVVEKWDFDTARDAFSVSEDAQLLCWDAGDRQAGRSAVS